MSTEEGIRIGLRAAATHLEEEAEECDKKATRLSQLPDGLNRSAALHEHANLLRKQANEIRALRVTRGR